ncbi:hypothetical protein GCM10027449_18840 [Sinomonas notoginsengisoli]|uniref:hypothetical protein n=1 Tax=Sinomonas notoginsengisoli TaxID=1457311 RepID=UPI001F4616F0|nr:hypothetical protein [Sinomonas notoginsengisoli]
MEHKPAILIALSAMAVALSACSGTPTGTTPASSSGAAAAPSTPAATSGATAGPSTSAGAEWGLVPANGATNIKAAGLTVLTEEGTAEHFHAHLDVIADGKTVPVPAEIGFSFGANGRPNGISALHTHDTSGVIHIEAPTTGQTYTLGQVLAEWGVLDGTSSASAGPHSDVTDWTVYVNGTKQSGNPRDVVLKPHAEIALVHGSGASTVPTPSSYAFPSGL